MQPDFWNDKRAPGVPNDIDLSSYKSVIEVFERSCKRFADRPAFSNLGVTLTYAELDRLSATFAAYLQKHTDLKPGDRIAVQMPNVLQYPIAVFGAMRAGLIVVNTNPLYTAREMRHQFKDAGVRALVYLNMFGKLVQEVLPDTEIEYLIEAKMGDMLPSLKGWLVNTVVKKVKKMVPDYHLPQAIAFKQVLKQGHGQTLAPVKVGHDDIAVLQYTGGTTGVAKGAMLLHRNIVANMLQAGAWVKPVVREGQEVIVTALPLYHIFSLTANLMVFTEIGALNILITNPRDIPGFIKEIKQYPVTAMTGVNTLFNALLNHPDFASVDFSTWRLALGGGMAVQKAVADKWKAVTGVPLIEAYGLTETSPAACMNPLDLTEYNGTIGVPIPSTEIQIRDSQGHEVAYGESGELCIRGPQVMKGYWRRPDETAKVIDEQGFLATGDMAMMTPEGFVKLVDRKKDMILVSGFNVYPNEVEDVVASHPGVLEVACVGVADEKSGEVVKVFVVRKDPALTEKDILAHCKANLTGYKVPKFVEFRDELPKTNVGKILRRALRDEKPGMTANKG